MSENTKLPFDGPKILSVVSLAVAALALGVLAASIFRSDLSGAGGPGGTGEPAIPISGTTSTGQEISLADYEGQVVVLDFWATWCPPCVGKLPELIAVQEEYGDRGVQVIGVSGDRSVEDLRRMEDDRQINFPTIFGGAEAALRDYNIRAFPTIVIIDQNGQIVHRSHHGNVRREVERLL